MAPSPVDEMTMLDLDRSNRGASKQRRDQINTEIGTMRDLLPLAESARQRLSQLQIMSLSCVYIRKCNILQKLFRSSRQGKDLPCDFFQALTGFILVTTREGKLLYISENVTDFLGHSMVDMKTQGDSLYDIVDKRDHVAVQTQLQGGDVTSSQDVAFFCRMNMSRSLKRQAGFGDVKVMHVRGHFTSVPGSETGSDQQYVFMATCTPLITPELKENLVQNNTMIFKTVHQLDMSFMEITETAEHHLGYTNKEISRKSWYTLLHPEDIHVAREKHVQLIRSSHEMGCMVTVRMLRANGSVIWINMVMHVRQAAVVSNDEPVIVCINQVISEQEAYQFKIQSNTFSIYPLRSDNMWSSGVGNLQSPHQTNQWIPNSPNYGQYPTMRQSPPGFQDHLSQPQYLRRGCTEQRNKSASLQTEKVKQMLQKKLTGCKPAKIPRVSATDRTDKQAGYQGDFGLRPTTNSYFGSFESFCDTSLSLESLWHAPTQVMSVSNYSVSSEPTMQKKGVIVEPSMLRHSACLSPNLLEQVVPDSGCIVPDSYLTPDPSPASSPEHKSSSEQTAGLDSSFELLDDLSKIEQFQQVQKIREERSVAEKAGMKRKRKELPLMDSLDIESFFDKLTPHMKREYPEVKPVIKTKSKPVKSKDLLPVIDSSYLEAFFNIIDDVEEQLKTTTTAQTAVKQEPVEQNMMSMTPCFRPFYPTPTTMQSSQSPLHSVPSPVSSVPEEFSPDRHYPSELSEEELMDEFNSTPVEMSLTVDVAEVKDEFEALQQAHFQPETNETELLQLQRLLSSLVPNSGSRNLLKDPQ
ncbi:hypothetical protein SNE40_009936 [Patella caerulea]|uniref:Uncharacterized protein n=1 Tax=Patella caerulea TaxID=87958 RepID=A0AAN8PTH7_PATCE